MQKKILARLENYPVIQNIAYSDRNDATDCKIADIEIILDEQTGLIYNTLFDSGLLEYTPDYDNEQSNSKVFQDHLFQVADIIKPILEPTDKIVEIGCGKGHFLELLTSMGFDVRGFDPTYEGENPKIEKQFFKKGSFKEVKLIVLRHVLEHIKDPVIFLKEIASANNNNGYIYIEVPCLDWIISNNAWYDFYYEHVNYFRISDFKKIFKNISFIGHVFNGQYIYLVAKLNEICIPKKDEEDDNVVLPTPPIEKMSSYNIDVVWGAGSKGIIFSMLLNRFGKILPKHIADINPNKIGKFAPISGIKIISPDECNLLLQGKSNVLVMNKNYLAEIKDMTFNKFNYIILD